METIGLGVLMFTVVILLLVAVLMFAKSKLVASGNVTIVINDDPDKALRTPAAATCSSTLAANKIFIPSACGGKGSCAMCKVDVLEGGGSMLPDRGAAHQPRRGPRGLPARLPGEGEGGHAASRCLPEIFSIQQVAVHGALEPQRGHLHQGAGAGAAHRARRCLSAPAATSRSSARRTSSTTRISRSTTGSARTGTSSTCGGTSPRSTRTVTRAYSMANYPEEKGLIMLNVRIASPPPRAPETTPPGKMSSYIFNLKPGDEVTISGPYGEFFAKDTDSEMCFIGGGAGMAPMRSHIFDLFRRVHTKRKVTFWYGARSLRETFYVDEFDADRRRTPELQVAPGALRAAAGRQLDRLHRLHPPGAPRQLPQGPPGAGGHRVLSLRAAHDDVGLLQDAGQPGRRAREHPVRRLRWIRSASGFHT